MFTFYHTTSYDNVESIKKSGLRKGTWLSYDLSGPYFYAPNNPYFNKKTKPLVRIDIVLPVEWIGQIELRASAEMFQKWRRNKDPRHLIYLDQKPNKVTYEDFEGITSADFTTTSVIPAKFLHGFVELIEEQK